MIECVPSARSDVLREAVPPLRGMLPEIGVPPSRNWTAPLPGGVTVAANTSALPITDGLAPELKVTARLEGEVLRSTGLFRGFWRTIGQSSLPGTKGECVSRMVTAPWFAPDDAWRA